MSELFDLPVQYNGKELLFAAAFLPMGYTHKIKVTVAGTDLLFEPDEEKNYRATVAVEDRDKFSPPDTELIRTICQTLDEVFGSGA